jgi:hypothetical protein
MLTLALVPLVAIGLAGDGLHVAAPAAPTTLAGALADADSVEYVRADRAHHTITFGITRAHEAYQLVVTTRDDGTLAALAIRDAGVDPSIELGKLSWLADEMADVDAIARLEIDAAGKVTIVTADDRRIAVVPGRGDGNDAARARWDAAWG